MADAVSTAIAVGFMELYRQDFQYANSSDEGEHVQLADALKRYGLNISVSKSQSKNTQPLIAANIKNALAKPELRTLLGPLQRGLTS